MKKLLVFTLALVFLVAPLSFAKDKYIIIKQGGPDWSDVEITGGIIAGVDISALEADPIVGAVTGIVKADGNGSISAATAGTDYLVEIVSDTTPQLGGELEGQGELISDIADAVDPGDAANLRTVLNHAGVTRFFYLGDQTLDQLFTDGADLYNDEAQEQEEDDIMDTIYFRASEADTLAPHTLKVGTIIDFVFDAKVLAVASKGEVTVYLNFGYVDSDGDPTSFQKVGASSNSTATLTTTRTTYHLHVDVTADTAIPITKRYFVQVVMDCTDTRYTTLWFYHDESAYHMSFSVGASILENFVKLAGDTMTGDLLIQAGFATQSYKTIYIPANQMTPTATSGATAGTHEWPTNEKNVDHIAFAKASEEYVEFERPFPEEYNLGTIKAKFYWSSATGSTDGDTVEWEMGCIAQGDDDVIDAAITGQQVITDTLLTSAGADRQLTDATPAITIDGTPALHDMIHCKVSRNISGTDDMAEEGWLMGVLIQYQEVATVVSAW